MKKELKEIITQSKKSLKKVEERIEDISEDFTDEVSEFWTDLKKQLSKVEEKLDEILKPENMIRPQIGK